MGKKADLCDALEASGRAIEQLLRHSLVAGGKIKGFKPHAVAFLGYLISHESHHRGQAGWALKLSGHPLDQKTAFGLWEWGSALIKTFLQACTRSRTMLSFDDCDRHLAGQTDQLTGAGIGHHGDAQSWRAARHDAAVLQARSCRCDHEALSVTRSIAT